MTNTLTNPYFNAVQKALAEVENTQSAAIETAAQALANTFAQGGILHTFGCGHSASVAVEAFHRSGCFAAVDAILDPGLMFHCGAHAGTAFERLEGYANAVLARHEFRPGDALLVVSNSGKNPAGVDAVLYAKKHDTLTIAITAASAHMQSKSRHSSGLLLKDAADIVLDNCSTANETALELGSVDIAPISTVVSSALFHAVLYRTAEIMHEQGLELPVYRSSNAGGDEHNAKLGKIYAGRIKHLD